MICLFEFGLTIRHTREKCYIFWENLINCNKLELRNILLWISVQLWYVQPLLQGNENWPKTICLLITSSILRPINKLEANSRLIYFCGLCYFGKRKTSLYSLYSKTYSAITSDAHFLIIVILSHIFGIVGKQEVSMY